MDTAPSVSRLLSQIIQMKRRSTVLHKRLKPFVDRKDITILAADLPPKREFVVTIKMTDFQIFLYSTFIDQLKIKAQSGSATVSFYII